MHDPLCMVFVNRQRHAVCLMSPTHRAASRRSKTPEGCSWMKTSASLLGKSCWGTPCYAEQSLHLSESTRKVQRSDVFTGATPMLLHILVTLSHLAAVTLWARESNRVVNVIFQVDNFFNFIDEGSLIPDPINEINKWYHFSIVSNGSGFCYPWITTFILITHTHKKYPTCSQPLPERDGAIVVSLPLRGSRWRETTRFTEAHNVSLCLKNCHSSSPETDLISPHHSVSPIHCRTAACWQFKWLSVDWKSSEGSFYFPNCGNTRHIFWPCAVVLYSLKCSPLCCICHVQHACYRGLGYNCIFLSTGISLLSSVWLGIMWICWTRQINERHFTWGFGQPACFVLCHRRVLIVVLIVLRVSEADELDRPRVHDQVR